MIRAMEQYLRKEIDNPFFKIECQAVRENAPFFDIGVAQYHPKRYFTIFYHPKMDVKKLRVCLAHELGHLFLIEIFNNSSDETFTENNNTEPISSIFGIFTIFHKNFFYEKGSRILNHKSPEDIIKDFLQLNNKNKNKLNIS